MLDRVWQTIDARGAELLLLLNYADICDDDGNGIWCSDEYTIWKTGVKASTLAAIKKKWREMKVLYPVGFYHLKSQQSFLADVNVVRGMGGRGWAVLYQLSLEPLPVKEEWKRDRSRKVPIDRTFNDGRKVPIDRTFPEAEGSNSQKKRSQPSEQKVPMAGAEGSNRLFAYKEDPLVEPLGNPLGEKRAPLSESVLIIAKQNFWRCFDQLQPDETLHSSADEWRRLGIATDRAGLTRTQVKEHILRGHLRYGTWEFTEQFDSQQDIPFPEASGETKWRNNHGDRPQERRSAGERRIESIVANAREVLGEVSAASGSDAGGLRDPTGEGGT